MKAFKNLVFIVCLSLIGGIWAYYNNEDFGTLLDAVKKGNKAKIKQLIEQQEGLVNVQNEYENTVLMSVVRMSYSLKKQKEIVKLLLDEGADPTIKNHKGLTALYYAKVNNRSEIISMLEEAIPLQLIKAVQHGNKKRVESLMKRGVNINATDKYGTNLLMFAIIENHKNILDLLLQQKGIQINKQSNDGTTPLILAAKRGKKDMVQLLLDKGADLTIKDNKGKTALDYAQNKNYIEIASVLFQALKKGK